MLLSQQLDCGAEGRDSRNIKVQVHQWLGIGAHGRFRGEVLCRVVEADWSGSGEGSAAHANEIFPVSEHEDRQRRVSELSDSPRVAQCHSMHCYARQAYGVCNMLGSFTSAVVAFGHQNLAHFTFGDVCPLKCKVQGSAELIESDLLGCMYYSGLR